MTQQLKRRHVLAQGGAAALSAPLAGCQFLSTEPDSESGDDNGDDPGVLQAPELVDLVENDDLPPLDERLPTEPLVVAPVDRLGQYGGQWRNALIGAGDAFRLSFTVGYENLVRWNLAWDEVVPNVAESFDIKQDGTQYTFRLREGLRWSDGEPFTADDVVFAYSDVLSNAEVTGTPPDLYRSEGGPATVERIDDYTVEFTFPEPNGLFLNRMASDPSSALTRIPRHYFEQFHPDYQSDADELAKQQGYADWADFFQLLVGGSDYWHESAIPTLFAWLPQDDLGEGERLVLRRNPYYWKTDPDGRQLPYVDEIVFDLVQDVDALLFKALNAEVDLVDRHVNTTENKPVLAREREVSGFGFFDLVSDKINTMMISLNLTSTDPVKREIFQNKEFRIGLSHAIDREEIIATVHAGQGEPWQGAPQRESEVYDEEMAKQYTEYDVAVANDYLDRAGFAERDDEGLRLGPDGEPIRFFVDVGAGAGKPHLLDGLELVRNYWREVGIDMRSNSVDLTLFNERREGNQAEGSVWDGDGGLDVLTMPIYYLPAITGGGYAEPWTEWYTSGGEQGEEPPAATRRQLELYDELKRLVVDEEQYEVMREILQIAKDEFYAIGISTAVPSYGVVTNRLHNMVGETFFATNFPYPGATHPEQYFIDER